MAAGGGSSNVDCCAYCCGGGGYGRRLGSSNKCNCNSCSSGARSGRCQTRTRMAASSLHFGRRLGGSSSSSSSGIVRDMVAVGTASPPVVRRREHLRGVAAAAALEDARVRDRGPRRRLHHQGRTTSAVPHDQRAAARRARRSLHVPRAGGDRQGTLALVLVARPLARLERRRRRPSPVDAQLQHGDAAGDDAAVREGEDARSDFVPRWRPGRRTGCGGGGDGEGEGGGAGRGLFGNEWTDCTTREYA